MCNWFQQSKVVFEAKYTGWHIDVLDAGYFARNNKGPNYELVKAVDESTGLPVDAPIKLNGIGLRLQPFDTPDLDPPWVVVDRGAFGVAVYKRLYPYKWTDITNIMS